MSVQWRILQALAVVTALSGCVSTNSSFSEASLLVEPAMPRYQDEGSIAKYTDYLSNTKLTQQQRARFSYERGVLYDRVGLSLLARYDFRKALNFEPKLADAYNFLGIYSTQEGNFDGAYESFDSVLELEPSYEYAYLNRGIALYYGKRLELSLSDIKTFYQKNPEDAYRTLWMYLAQYELNSEKAKIDLQAHSRLLNDEDWSTKIVDYYLGKITSNKLINQTKQYNESDGKQREYAEHLCEAYFYIAKQKLMNGENEKATQYFRLALATNVYDFVEYRYAGVELAKLEGEAE